MMNTVRKFWSKKDLSLLKEYILHHKDWLRRNFYMNIRANRLKFRKLSGFFVDMGKKVGRATEHCKSKFQKFERHIYTRYLKIPSNHYLVFCYVRKQEQIKAQSTEKTQTNDFLNLGKGKGSKGKRAKIKRGNSDEDDECWSEEGEKAKARKKSSSKKSTERKMIRIRKVIISEIESGKILKDFREIRGRIRFVFFICIKIKSVLEISIY